MMYENMIAKQIANLPKPNQRWNIIALLSNKKPVTITTNDTDKTHPDISRIYPHRRTHAEFRCINKTPKDKLKNAILTVVRWNGEQFKLAKPCDMCMEYIIEAGIKRVIYSTNDNNFAEIKI